MNKYLAVVVLSSALSAGVAQAAPTGDAVVRLDGSSTVYPISEAVAEEFGKETKIKVTVGISGTGGGFKKFCSGETDISNASRPIKPSEIEMCEKAGIQFIELPVAYDALTVVVNKNNTWMESISIEELKKLWEPQAQGAIMQWNQIRADWPATKLALFGPGTDSGTFDYFTEAIVGKEDASRGDYTSSEDDNVLVQGVSSDPNALGYFGLAYFEENQGKLRAVPVDNGEGPQTPTLESVISGTYRPLSRPLFIYVSAASLKRPEVESYLKYYLANVSQLVQEVGYVPLSENVLKLATQRFSARQKGSIFKAGMGGVTLEKRLQDALASAGKP